MHHGSSSNSSPAFHTLAPLCSNDRHHQEKGGDQSEEEEEDIETTSQASSHEMGFSNAKLI